MLRKHKRGRRGSFQILTVDYRKKGVDEMITQLLFNIYIFAEVVLFDQNQKKLKRNL